MTRVLVWLVTITFGLAAVAASPVDATGGERFPSRIPLPDGFFPEGIAISGRTAYVGSLVDGAIQQQDLPTGRSREFAPPPGESRIAVGMDVDRWGRLWVAGGGPAVDPDLSASFRVYDTKTGELLLEQDVEGGFVNDVIVTRHAAWFTDSIVPSLVRVPLGPDGSIGAPQLVPLAGDWTQAVGFNANGIVTTPDGKHLIVAQSTAPDVEGAALYRVRVDRHGEELDARRIDLDGTLAGADGLVLVGRTLYSVAGADGVVKIRMSPRLDRGRIVDTLPVPDSISPTTADVFGPRLYVVDAKFPLFGDPTVPFETTAIRR